VRHVKFIFLLSVFSFIPNSPAYSFDLDPEKKNFLLNVLGWEKVIGTALGIMAIAFVGRKIRSITDRMAKRWNSRRMVLLQARSIVVFIIYFLGAWAITRHIWGLSHEGLLLFGATLAVALGFALKPIAESVIGGLVLIFDGPFQVGDRVTFKGTYGDVQSIGFRATRLLTLDQTLVTIPNHLFMEEATFCGNTGVLEMMVDMDFYVSLTVDLSLAKKLVEEAVKKTNYVDHQKPVVVLVKEIPLGLLPAYQLRAKVVVQDFVKEKLCLTDLTLKVHELFQQNNISRLLLNLPATDSTV